MGKISNTNSQVGIGVNTHLYVGKSLEMALMANIAGSYLMRNEFDDLDRSLGDYIYIDNQKELAVKESSKKSGIVNRHVEFSFGLAKDVLLSLRHQNNGLYYTSMCFGGSLGIDFDSGKRKNAFFPLNIEDSVNSIKISLRNIDMYSWKAGIFIDMMHRSGKFIGSVFGETGTLFYGKGAYLLDAFSVIPIEKDDGSGVTIKQKTPVNLIMSIKTRDEVGSYGRINTSLLYRSLNFLYVGIGLNVVLNYKMSNIGSEILYSSEENAQIFVNALYNIENGVRYYPFLEGDKFKEPLSNNLITSFHFIAMYIRN